MNTNKVTIDDTQVRKMFAELSPSKRKQAFKQAIRSGLNILKRHTVANLKHAVNPSTISKKDKYGNSLRKGIRVKAYKKGDAGVIHILGNYKLKFFELGTADRYVHSKGGRSLKKARYTGKIPAYHFFRSAKRESETEVFNSIDNLLRQSIKKINDKYKGKAK